MEWSWPGEISLGYGPRAASARAGYSTDKSRAGFFLRFYLFIYRQREKQAPHWDPDVGLNPGSLGSLPETKADAQPLTHTAAP